MNLNFIKPWFNAWLTFFIDIVLAGGRVFNLFLGAFLPTRGDPSLRGEKVLQELDGVTDGLYTHIAHLFLIEIHHRDGRTGGIVVLLLLIWTVARALNAGGNHFQTSRFLSGCGGCRRELINPPKILQLIKKWTHNSLVGNTLWSESICCSIVWWRCHFG